MSDLSSKKTFWGFVKTNKISFFVNFFVISFITFGILFMFGLVPKELQTSYGIFPEDNSKNTRIGEVPVYIKIPSINVDIQVFNPQSTSTEIMDSFLFKGVVHYPGSGLLGNGNVFIFGHSSRLSVVNNQGYKAFSGLRDLKVGDLVHVYSDKSEFIYSVNNVKLKKADEALVVFDAESDKLTLSSCNIWGAKEERYVMEADFVEKRLLPVQASN